MKTARVVHLLVVACFLAAALPAQAASLPPAEPFRPADLLQFTAGGHALGFAAGGMYAAAGDHALHVDFVGANAVRPQADSPGGADGMGAPLGRVAYPDLWDGITLTYSAAAGGIYTTTYTLAPGADPAAIRLEYNAPPAVNDDGTLGIAFAAGTMTESAPIAWQEIQDRRVAVDVSFQVSGQEASFTLGSYDPLYTLTIDPSIIWNTFLGGSGNDWGYSIAVDGSGNVYLTGYSTTTWGSPVRAYSGSWDAFAAKLNSSGELIWNTFLGGSAYEFGYGIAVDGSGNVYVTGESDATWGSPVRSYAGSIDAFAAKLDSDGGLTWNTFLGGYSYDYGYGIAVDGSGNVYVEGDSEDSWGSPVHNYYMDSDAFTAKLDASGGLTWNTFLGGGGDDDGRGIAVDDDENVYITGTSVATWGSPVRAKSGSYGSYDAFAAKLDSAGALTWNTFLGGSGNDYGRGIAVDGSGNVYVTGESNATWGSPVRLYTGGADAFVAELDAAGGLAWNTFLGGSGSDVGNGIAVDEDENVYITGTSIATWGSPVRAHSGDGDALTANLDSSTGTLVLNTFLGGSDNEYGYGIAVDGSGNVYVTGTSGATWGTPVCAYTGGADAFAAKVDLIPPTVVSSLRASVNPTSAANVNFTVTFSEAVTDVDASDFTLSMMGVSGASVTAVSGSGDVRTVTVDTGTGSGTLRLDLTDDDSILDPVSNPLGGTGAGNGNFIDGEAYTIVEPIEIRWFIGLGVGTDPAQVAIEQAVADDFNTLHPDLHLVLEVVDSSIARDTLAAEIAAENGPDIIGPVGWAGFNYFHGQSLDLAPLIASTGFDTTQFNTLLVNMYNTDEGQVALPFSVYPSAIFYNPAMFTAAGLNPPPAHYGDTYTMPDDSVVDWTWDTVADVSKLLTLDGDGDNATDPGFDPGNIVQYGFSYGWENHPNFWGSFWEGGTLVQGASGAYAAVVPNTWRESWQWFYDGIWGSQPYAPDGAAYDSMDGNVLDSGTVAMVDIPSWYTCCLSDLAEFQFGAMPSYDGEVAGRMDADTFRIWEGTEHPDESFTALTYLVTTGVDKLVVGTEEDPPAYGGMPALTDKQDEYLDLQAKQFPFVTGDSWDVLMAGLEYPDVPSAEGYMPHYDEAWIRLITFGSLLSNTSGLNLDRETACLEADLTAIFNGDPAPGCVYISGNAGVGGATLSYDYNGAKTAVADGGGDYWLMVSNPWTGTVTPAKTGYTFTPDHITYTGITSDRTDQDYTATQVVYTLTVNIAGSGTVNRSIPAPYHWGDAVGLTPVPASGWSFSAWSGACTGSGACSVTMDSDKAVGAVFTQACYTLTRTHTGTGGDPAASPANSSGCSAGKYHSGESIALTASPAGGWAVGGWSGTNNNASTSTANGVTMPAGDRTVTVNYTRFGCPLKGLLLYDFNGDCKTDVAVYRPSTGAWYIRNQYSAGYGTAGDKPVPGDYNGDGTTDIAVFRPSTGAWYVRGGTTVYYGVSTDIPVPGDYNADAKTEPAVYRPSTGAWYVRGMTTVYYGASTDIPVPGDYTGSGLTQIAVYRPSTGAWYIRGMPTVYFGVSTDIPVPGDYNGDHVTDIAVFRPSTGAWYIRGGTTVYYGASGDIPVPGDYDGDGATELGIFRPSTGAWYVQGQTTVYYGASGDIPLPELGTGKASTAP